MNIEQAKSLIINEVYLMRIGTDTNYFNSYLKFKGKDDEDNLILCKNGKDDELEYYNIGLVNSLGTYEENNNRNVETLLDVTIVEYDKDKFSRYVKGNQVENITNHVNSNKKLFYCKNQNDVSMSIPLEDIKFIYYSPMIQTIKFDY